MKCLPLYTALLSGVILSHAQILDKTYSVPGTVTTDWIGNTFGFAELVDSSVTPDWHLNHKWVQNFIHAAWVSADGRVFTHSDWDEGGRAAGIYKDGDVVGQLADPTKAIYGIFGDIVGDDQYIYASTKVDYGNWDHHGFGIRRYHMTNYNGAGWVGGDGNDDSYWVIRTTGENPKRALLAYDSSTEELTVADDDTLYVYDTKTPVQTPKFKQVVPGIIDMVSDHQGRMWIIRGGKIERVSNRFVAENVFAPNPAGLWPKLGWSRDGRLLVWDDEQLQVLFYSNPGLPNESVTKFGAVGGIYSGTPGEVLPQKLLPRATSIGTDANGNLYMTWGAAFPPSFSEVRSWNPAGAMRWELMAHLFVHCGGFDARSDGKEIWTTQTRYTMDYTKPNGKKWTYKSYLWDRKAEPDIPSIGGSVIVRYLQGKKLIVKTANDLYADGFRFYVENGQMLKPVGSIIRSPVWGWWIDTLGGVWQGEHILSTGQRAILRYPFKGWNGDTPEWDMEHPESWFRDDLVNFAVDRVFYDPTKDMLILTGGNYTGQWGQVGQNAIRIDGVRSGKLDTVWRINLPLDTAAENTSVIGTYKSLWVEGDYMFFASAFAEPRMIHVYKVSDGTRLGGIGPGAEVGGDRKVMGSYGHTGWIDMVWGVQAFQRKNGEFLILLEDDLSAKNNLYRWCPSSNCPEPTPVFNRPYLNVRNIKNLGTRKFDLIGRSMNE